MINNVLHKPGTGKTTGCSRTKGRLSVTLDNGKELEVAEGHDMDMGNRPKEDLGIEENWPKLDEISYINFD